MKAKFKKGGSLRTTTLNIVTSHRLHPFSSPKSLANSSCSQFACHLADSSLQGSLRNNSLNKDVISNPQANLNTGGQLRDFEIVFVKDVIDEIGGQVKANFRNNV